MRGKWLNNASSFLDEEDKVRVKMGRLKEDEERDALKLFEKSKFYSLCKSFLGPSRVPYIRHAARPTTKDGRHPFHFSYQCMSKLRDVSIPDNRLFFENTSIFEQGINRSEYGIKFHKSLRSRETRSAILSVAKGAKIPAGSNRISSVFGIWKGIPRGAAARFATSYLVRPGSCEEWDGDPSVVSSEGGLDYNFWLSIEDFESRKNARIQNRIIAELPHEDAIGPIGRRKILKEFSQWFDDRNLPYVGVVHLPDKNGDHRNFHMHFVFHDRPVINIAGNIMRDKFKNVEVQDVDYIKSLKSYFADIVNIELEQEGIARRYSEESYDRLNIEKIPSHHLGTKASALSRKGVDVREQYHNDLTQHHMLWSEIVRPTLEMFDQIKDDDILDLCDAFRDAFESVMPSFRKETLKDLETTLGKYSEALEGYLEEIIANAHQAMELSRVRQQKAWLPKAFEDYILNEQLDEASASDAAALLSHHLTTKLSEGIRMQKQGQKKETLAEAQYQDASHQLLSDIVKAISIVELSDDDLFINGKSKTLKALRIIERVLENAKVPGAEGPVSVREPSVKQSVKGRSKPQSKKGIEL